MPNSSEAVSVALLYQTSQLEGHLKDALKELGAAVVYEALTAQMDRDALEGSGAHVVIVNLDPEIEAHLDEVYDLLDDERYNVVFNDAQVSSALSGWEQARWSRHLAAKIMGRPEVADPPRPPGAEAPPSPAQKIARSIPDVPHSQPPGHVFAPDAAAAAMFSNDVGLSDALDALFGQAAPPATSAPAAPASPPAADFGFDFDELLSSDAAPAAPDRSTAITLELPQPPLPAPADFDFDLPAAAPPRAASAAADLADTAFDLDFDVAPPPPAVTDAFDLNFDLDDAPAPPASTSTSAASRFDLDFDLGATEPVPASNAAVSADLDTDFSFGAELDALFATPEAPAAPASELIDFDAAFSGSPAAPAADSGLIANIPVARDATPPARSVQLPRDLSDWSLEPLSEDDGSEAAPAAPVEAPKAKDFGVEKLSAENFLSGGNWSLEDIVESDGDDSAAAPRATVAPVDKVAAQDYLAPEGGDASKFDFDTALKLDLMPMEEAVSPERERADFFVEHRLDGSAPVQAIRRVIVLGASIGGPEAVREFLAGLPPRFPALFVLAQHMGAEFLELMASQLAKATPLTVRAPGHGERVSHGEVVVVPTTHRMLIDADGTVHLAHLPEASPYTPSIDLIVRDMADRFGEAATLIVFSGMAHDAIEGAKHLAAKGGKVWVQDPDTCVISSMVDGAREAGVVTFTGSPAALTQHTIATVGKA